MTQTPRIVERWRCDGPDDCAAPCVELVRASDYDTLERELAAANERAERYREALEREGWKMVPVEPTREMLDAACDMGSPYECWNAMLAAAAQPQETGA